MSTKWHTVPVVGDRDAIELGLTNRLPSPSGRRIVGPRTPEVIP